MNKKYIAVFSLPVIVAALGYFVDIYDLLLFNIVRIPSLRSLGLNAIDVDTKGEFIIGIQMLEIFPILSGREPIQSPLLLMAAS